jgi:hypothetical protein
VADPGRRRLMNDRLLIGGLVGLSTLFVVLVVLAIATA